MAEKSQFELPASTEKLSHKFIFDALKEHRNQNETPVNEPLPAPETESEMEDGPQQSTCGTQAAPVGKREEPPITDGIPLPDLTLPIEKKYFRIGEVSELIGVEPYVLRYWESEFSAVRPTKSRSGQRVYSRRDVENLHLIRHLLYTEKFSIKGAKKQLAQRRKQLQVQKQVHQTQNQEKLRALLDELKELVSFAKSSPGSF